ncbi:type I polyketide synthase [Bacillus pumilus]|uniref:type I polyketide synthase n=1 Tax=Bacillus pumilus TaxID=1408 RepID=UPI0021137C17|nr:type I polyketide synthase [Bacillus pumilus]UUD43343.1 acyltransferase domain-containing protein [Bacillus pumilus]
MSDQEQWTESGLEIAVVGLAGTFPGAPDVQTFWENVSQGKESVTFFTDEELKAAGVDETLLKHPDYVKAKPYLQGAASFDADFFGYTPREASIMDPQIRLMHECTWHALEDAGYEPEQYDGLIGLYAGASSNLSWMGQHMSSLEKNEDVFQIMHLNDPSFASRVAYKLNLKGPSVSVQTACSTSLVAIHMACQGLIGGECDLALAGGVTLHQPQITGYQHQEGMIYSPDGHCRPFDEKAKGTIFGEGAGVVALKRLKDALEDGDFIYAVVKGSATNNDGSNKVGYTAPSVSGQASVIESALEMAETEPETISYIEAHGTGTPVGDPIEIEALTRAFQTDQQGFCRIGSVKANIGHLDAASGVAGFIKTVMMLHHRQFVPMPHFDKPNHRIPFDQTPFYVGTNKEEWKASQLPRRAGVSAFGIGGANAHVILEEAKPRKANNPDSSKELIVLSARSKHDMKNMTKNLKEYVSSHHELSLGEAAYTLQSGRRAFQYRKTFVCSTRDELLEQLQVLNEETVGRESALFKRMSMRLTGYHEAGLREYIKLYEKDHSFKTEVDRFISLIQSVLPIEKDQLFHSKQHGQAEVAMLIMTSAFAYQLRELGIEPDVWIGEGSGVWTALYAAGGLELTEAASIVYHLRDTQKVDQWLSTLPPKTLHQPVYIQQTGEELTTFQPSSAKRFLDMGQAVKPSLIEQESTALIIDLSMKQGIMVEKGAEKTTEPLDGDILQIAGVLWEMGVDLAFPLTDEKNRQRIPLPGYPFHKKDFSAQTKPMAAIEPYKPQEEKRVFTSLASLQKDIHDIVQTHFGFDQIDDESPFFEFGATSLDISQLAAKISERMDQKIDTVQLYRFATVASLSEYLFEEQAEREQTPASLPVKITSPEHTDIAIVGMAGRFPGASSLEDFWQRLVNGEEMIHFFTEEELKKAGLDASVYQHPNFIGAKGRLQHIEGFDADFFNYSAREAELMDPQFRLLHECAWEALEDAGCDPDRMAGKIGVYTGTSPNHEWLTRFAHQMEATEQFSAMLLNDREFFSTQLSYKLNLHGPSVTMQTACSTSLVNIGMACQALLNQECDAALAGGVTVSSPENIGYIYQDGMIQSKDGHCRPFDQEASGTIFGDGAGIVLLKRYEDAIRDGNPIHAVIKGVGVNNDGNRKAGFTAPSVEGQAEVLKETYEKSGIDPASIGYLEAHGTGTKMGDPIEVSALSQVFKGTEPLTIPIGSVKSNVGHLNSAAGIAGLFKAILAIQHKTIPPTIHYESPNEDIPFKDTPFYVNQKALYWKEADEPRRAGVSSFGIGGTNAHMIIEEGILVKQKPASLQKQLLVLSAKTDTALAAMTDQLKHYVIHHPQVPLEDIAYTLRYGRKQFPYRKAIVLSSADEWLQQKQLETNVFRSKKWRKATFMFSGQGAQYAGMMRGLYEAEPVFKWEADRCFKYVLETEQVDLKAIVFSEDETNQDITKTSNAQPLLFIFEYALAKLLQHSGVEPESMIGHSIGEYVAACLSGVFSLESALTLVMARGRMMQGMEKGAMLSVQLPEAELGSMIDESLSVAAVNAKDLCVVSGQEEHVNAFEKKLQDKGIVTRQLHTSHAFHSYMMEPMLEAFHQFVEQVELHEPTIPFISNVTGTWATSEEVMTASYWTNHLRGTVRFHAGLSQLFTDEVRAFIEVGPGNSLTALAKRHENKESHHEVLNMVRHAREQADDHAYFLKRIGELWAGGYEVKTQQSPTQEERQLISLPTYPFERKRYWIEAGKPASPPQLSAHKETKKKEMGEWFYLPSWEQQPLEPVFEKETEEQTWLIFREQNAFHELFTQSFNQQGIKAISVTKGEAYQEQGQSFTINPAEGQHYRNMLDSLSNKGVNITRILHLWEAAKEDDIASRQTAFQAHIEKGYYSLIFLSQAIAAQKNIRECRLFTVTSGIQPVTGHETICAEKSAMLGPCKVISQEYHHIKCWNIDVEDVPDMMSWKEQTLVDLIVQEIMQPGKDQLVAYRNRQRWVQSYKRMPLQKEDGLPKMIRPNGVYLITGGLGGIGFVLSKMLAKEGNVHLYLTGRTALPPRGEWASYVHQENADEAQRTRIEKVLELERLGATVEAVQANAGNLDQMKHVFEAIRQKHGGVHGVFHAAGLPGSTSFRAIKDIPSTLAQGEDQFQSKVKGLDVLEQLLDQEQADFCLLFSSISALLGGLGFSAYSAANLYMDAFAARINQHSQTPWMCVNWDAWNFWGELESTIGESINELAILPEEGAELFQYVLSNRQNRHMLVSTGSLDERIDQWLSLEPKAAESEDSYEVSKHERPELSNPYVAPRNETEKAICQVWQDFMGMEQVGIHDNFFDLGASSLDIVQVTNRLNQALQTNEAVVTLFTYPSVAELAKYIKPSDESKEESMEEELAVVTSGDRRARFKQQRNKRLRGGIENE